MATNPSALGAYAAKSEPRGGRIGVAYDWGFGVQMALMSVLTLGGAPIGGVAVSPLAGLGLLGAAAAAFVQGEALRRGNGRAWWVQVLGNSALTVAGVGGLALLPQMLAQGRYSYIYTLALLLIVSPLEAWLLTRPGSRRWYGFVEPAAARARHSGPWMIGTVAWALVCGVLQTAAGLGWI